MCLISSNPNSSPIDPTTVNNKLLAVNIDQYPFEQTYNEEDLNVNWNPDTQKYTGFLPVNIKATGVPNYVSFYADVNGELFEQPIEYNGKYKFVLKNDGPFASGLMPQFMEDQNSNSYDLYINVPNSGESITPNKATLKISDPVINLVRREGSMFDGKITLPNPVFNVLTDFENNNKDYATELEIDVNGLTLPNLKNGIVVNQQGEWNVVNNDGNNDDIEFEKDSSPTPQLLIKKAPLLRDDPTEDDTETKLGSFTVNIPPPNISQTIQNNGYYNFNEDWTALIQGTEQNHKLHIQVPTSGSGSANILSLITNILSPPTWDGQIENTKTITNVFNISNYNQTNNTNYDGVSEVITTGELVRYVWNGEDSWTDYTIEEYNQENNTNYIGFSSIDLGTNFPSGSGNIYNEPVVFRQSGYYMNMQEIAMAANNPMLEMYDGISNITIDVSGGDSSSANIGIITVPTITTNGQTIIRTWEPSENPDGYDAWDQVTINVEVPQNQNLEQNKELNISNSEFGSTVYLNPSTGYDGFSNAIINVPNPNLYTLPTITNNGTYDLPTGYDGFASPITINTPTSVSPVLYFIGSVGTEYGQINYKITPKGIQVTPDPTTVTLRTAGAYSFGGTGFTVVQPGYTFYVGSGYHLILAKVVTDYATFYSFKDITGATTFHNGLSSLPVYYKSISTSSLVNYTSFCNLITYDDSSDKKQYFLYDMRSLPFVGSDNNQDNHSYLNDSNFISSFSRLN